MDALIPFKRFSRYLGISNFLQFILVILALQFTSLIEGDLGHILYYISAGIVLLVDLLLTYKFLILFTKVMEKPSAKNPVMIYVIFSLITRIFTILYLIRGDFANITFYLISLTAILFGWILFSLSKIKNFVHQDKLQLIAYANLVGVTGFMGYFLQEIFLGMKVLLPLPASIVYFMLSVDFKFLPEVNQAKQFDSEVEVISEDNITE